MKTKRLIFIRAALVLGLLVIEAASSARAATTIDAVNHYAYGGNIGWVDWRNDTSHGAVIGEYVCSGYLYAANVGWINLGSGSPANHIRYQNNSATDFGVNQDGRGNLRGYAWGANIGWIRFGDVGAPRIDLKTGAFSGYAYSANCGWISLSNAFAVVQTDVIMPGVDTDHDGIADAWELTYTNTLEGFTATGDADGDGVSDLKEYLADTSPTNPRDFLAITSLLRGTVSPDSMILKWTSKPTRCYEVEVRPMLDASTPWRTYKVLSTPGANALQFSQSGNVHFYRVGAFLPLAP